MATEEEMSQAQREFQFTNEMIHCRELLQPIIDGVIERGRRKSQYDVNPGTRKTTLKDAKEIAKVVVFRINRAVNAFDAKDDI